ncbi:hypothetical protein BV372_19110 [Nostoc sp. T09]|uniref:Uma2 family endonuclease n=1 Tax=Nostoc sp. T09 TaxID=1932621 RepID=UPI000A38A152|nr:Uma2 family endonuclease [Nostoc sp. T09]OUL32583.1 hypothetical protein BV372_19110 [Nostoc sp. T09]
MVRTSTKWTVEEYHRMIETGLLAGRQVELIDGNIIDMAPELPIHRATYRRGVKYLESMLGDQGVIFSSAPILLSSNGEPQPDICIAVPPESSYDERHPEPVDIYWLIEVSNSTLSYDLEEKASLYARNGIKEYWVIDIPNSLLWVHRQPVQGQYQSVWQLQSGLIASLAFPDIDLEVDKFLR